MPLLTKSFISRDPDSAAAGRAAADAVRGALGDSVRAVLVFATVQHDAAVVLGALRAALGPGVEMVGCSTQGVMGRSRVDEDGHLLGVMGFGGELLSARAARVTRIEEDTLEKGRELGRAVAAMEVAPKLVLVHYDPLTGCDLNLLLRGIHEHVRCAVVGGGAGAPFGRGARSRHTTQFFGGEACEHAAVALALAGDFEVDVGLCHGTVPTGIVMTVNKTDGMSLLEIDGQPALEVWSEMTGSTSYANHADNSTWGVGVKHTVLGACGESLYLIRAAFSFDPARGALGLQVSIPEGTEVMFHHRTRDAVMEGTRIMGAALAERVRGKRVRAALGYECGARTNPYLGREDTLCENTTLQETAAPDAEWLGMMAWGELADLGGEPGFFNYAFPLVLLSDER